MANFDDLYDEGADKIRAKAALRYGIEAQPDAVARDQALARRYGVPPAVIEQYRPDYEARAKVEDASPTIEQSPKLRGWLAEDFNRAKLAHDDLENMGAMERTLKGSAGDVIVTALKGAMGLPQAFVGLADIPTFGYVGKGLDAIGLNFNEAQKIAEGLYSPAQQAANRRVREADGFFETIGTAVQNPSVLATTVGESLPQMLGGAAAARGLLGLGAKTLGAGVAGPALPGLLARTAGASAPLIAGAAGEGIIGAGSAAEQIRGANPDGTLSVGQVAASIASGVGTGMFSVLGGKVAQKLGIADIDTALASGQLTQAAIKKGLGRQLAEAGISEGVLEELPQSAQEQVWQNIATDRPWDEGVANAAAMGLLAGAVTGGGFQGVQYLAARNIERAQAAEQNARTVEQINELAKASKLAQRDPATFEAFVAQAAEGGPVQDVYINAQTLAQSGMAEQIAAVSPAVAEQLQTALATGGDIKIPVVEYTARIAPTEYAQGLLDHLKTEPQGMSRAEAQEFMQSQAEVLKAEVEKVLAEKQGDETFKASGQEVEDWVFNQMQGAGRFTESVNRADAMLYKHFFSVMGAKTGRMPMDLFKDYLLRVQAEGVTGGQQFDQGGTLADVLAKWEADGISHDVIEKKGIITLGKIVVPDSARGVGKGTAAMQALIDYADRTGQRIDLGASSQLGGDKARLVEFYERFGFKRKPRSAPVNKPFKDTAMLREPRQLNQSANPFDGPEQAKTPIGDATTVEVDGAQRPALNSNGQPIHSTVEGVRNFWRWFGDSKVVDAEGRPLVVYHGTKADIAAFDPEQIGSNYGMDRDGFFFSGSTVEASGYADPESQFLAAGMSDNRRTDPKEGANVVPAYLSLQNPLTLGTYTHAFYTTPEIEIAEQGISLVDYFDDNRRSIVAFAKDGGHDGILLQYKGKTLGVAFNPTQIKSATGNRGTFDGGDANILNQSGADNFKAWAGTDRPVIEPNEINDFDFSRQGPFVVRAFHGTTNTFDEFNAGVKGNVEGQFGAVNYLTSSEQDAADNYAGDGPDLTSRIEQKAERLVDEIQDLYDEVETNEGEEAAVQAVKDRYGEEFYDEDTMEMARNIARQELHGGDEIVMEVFVKTERPFVVGDVNSPWLEFFDEAKLEADAIERAADDTGIDIADIEANPSDYQDQIDDARYQIMDEQGNAVVQAVQTVAGRYDFDPSDLLSELYEMPADGSVQHNRLEEFMRQSESLAYAERPDDGALVQSQMIGEIIRELGFDSIILKNANVRFKNMNMEKGTAHIHVFDANNTNIKSATGNAGTYDPNDPNIYRQNKDGNRGAFNPATNTITLLKNADLSTFLHESGHFFLEVQFDIASRLEGQRNDGAGLTPGEEQILADTSALLKWFGVESLNEWYGMDFGAKRSYHEQFARGFEAYLFEGKAPSIELQGLFQRFRAWLLNVYRDIKNLNVDLTDEVRGVMDRMLATTEEIKLAEQGRSMMPLFTSPDQAGMTPDEFAAYQALGVDATNDAIQDVQARTLRDLAWTRNARGREIKRLQKEAAALRREVQIGARRDVMSQPVYRVWQFLTGKLTTEEREALKTPTPPKSGKGVDESIDSLFVAIAKMGGLDRKVVESQWGWDPKERSPQPAFGAYLLRREGGLSLDAMGELLAERGYLPLDENGKFDLRDFEELFDAEYRGDPQYSTFRDPGRFMDMRPGDQIRNVEALAAGRLDLTALKDVLVNMAPMASPQVVGDVLNQSAYHGTPHRGIEKFSTDKIGTGEGAQAYGWGLYFASKREIAEHYRRSLSRGVPTVKVNGRTIKGDVLNTLANRLNDTLDSISKDDVLAEIDRRIAAYDPETYAKWAIKELNDARKKLEKAKSFEIIQGDNPGQLYEVEIPEDSEMLLWDKPLSEQPEAVRKALASFTAPVEKIKWKVNKRGDYPMHSADDGRYGIAERSSGSSVYYRNESGVTETIGEFDNAKDARKGAQQHADNLVSSMAGASFYSRLTREKGSDKAASEALAALGIKGIKYLDGTSRANGDGSYNYVVFSGDDVAITDQFYQSAKPAPVEGEAATPQAIIDRLVAYKMAAKDGLHPDIVADMFGFTSGDELVRALAAATPPKEEIEGLTDARMLERYGDLATPEAIERAADKAIHNDARARFVATEANALAKATGQRKILASAARDFARAMIARLKVRDIRPGQYASAEVRAAKAAEKASQSGDLAKAAAEKRNQLVNNYATRAAYDAQDEVEKGVRYLKKFENEGTRKGLDADYTDQIDALLERFDLRKGQSLKTIDKRTALAAWVESQREQGLEPEVPEALLNEANRTSYKNLTVEEFRGLVDTVKQIEHLGRLKDRLLTAADNRAFTAVKAEIVQSIEANAGNRQADTRTPITNLGRALQQVKRFYSAHIKAATWARIMDGGKDGGPMWEYFIRSANERGDMETTMRAEATIRLSEIMAPVFKLGKMGGKGQFFPTINRSLNREARIAIALNTGNQGNLQRLLGGEGWTVQQIAPVLQSLTAAEWQAVQAVWDHFESYRPQIEAKERRVYGRSPEWVEPAPFQIKISDGEELSLRGGYYPIKYDPAASQRAEEHADAEGAKRQLQGAYTTATTRRSFTKTRAEEVQGRPLLYTLAGLYSGVNDVIHDLAWHEWLIDANRLLRSKSIDAAIRNTYGPEAKAQFKSWAADIAEGDQSAHNAGEVALARLRQGISAAGLGFNVMSAAIQVLGFSQSIVRVGPTWVGKGIARYVGQPLASAREVNAKSEFMVNRSRTRFRELNELRNTVQDESDTMRHVKAGTYFLMMRAQQMVDVPTWLGAYEKALADGNVEERAIALADQAVIDAQGGGQTKDLAAIERGGPAMRLFTVFYSFMNTAFNLGVGQTMTAKSKARLAADYLLIFVAPAVLGSLLKDALTPGGDDDEDLDALAKKLAAEQLSYLMGMMVVVREFSFAAKTIVGAEGGHREYTGPAGLRLVSDMGALVKQASQGEFDDAFRKAAINVVGDFTGLPSAQVNRTITGTKALAEGETENPAAVVFGFQRDR